MGSGWLLDKGKPRATKDLKLPPELVFHMFRRLLSLPWQLLIIDSSSIPRA